MAPPHIPDTLFDLHSQRPLKAQLTAEVSAAASEGEASQIRAAFEQKEKALEHGVCPIVHPMYPSR